MHKIIDKLFQKIKRLELISEKRQDDINLLKIENLFLKERIQELKGTDSTDQGEHASDTPLSFIKKLSQ